MPAAPHRFRPIVALVALLGGAACTGHPASTGTAALPTARAAGGVPAVRLPAVFSDSYVFLRAVVGGRPVLLLFDSGAGATVLDPTLVARLGLAERGRRVTLGMGGVAPQASVYDGVVIRFGEDSITTPAVLSWSGADLPPLGTERTMGIIGADLLRMRVLEIDWPSGSMFAWDTTALVRAAPGDREVPISIVQSLPVLAVRAHVAGRADSVPVVLDYGSSGALILDGDTDASRRIAPALRDVRSRRVIGVGGAVDGPEGRLDSLVLGGVSLRGPLAFIDTAGVRTVSLAGAQGLVGTELLRRMSVVLDYPRGRAVFRPTRRAGIPFCRNASGVCFERSNSGVVRVVFVDPNSPAARSGLAAGDVLLTLDGLVVSELGDRELDMRLDFSGMMHVAEVRRGVTAASNAAAPAPVPSRARQPRAPAPVVVRWRL